MAVLYDALCDDSRLVRFAQDLKLEDQIEVDVAVLCLSISHQRELASFAVTQAELEVTDLPLLDVYLEILGVILQNDVTICIRDIWNRRPNVCAVQLVSCLERIVGTLAEYRPLRYHEDIVVFYRGTHTYNPQKWMKKVRGNKNFGKAGGEEERFPKSILPVFRGNPRPLCAHLSHNGQRFFE